MSACHLRTNVEATEFVPYGIHVVEDAERMRYNQQLLAFSKYRLLPALVKYEEVEGHLPEHLAKASAACSLQHICGSLLGSAIVMCL